MYEGYAETPGARLWYWDTGGDGEALVLCHPASQSCQIWEHQRDAFARAGYRVIAYSRRGYYRSETGDEDNSGTQVEDLANLLRVLGCDRVHVLGAAAGGITAAGFAVACPENVLSLSLAGTIVAPDEGDWRELYDRLGIADIRHAVPTEFLELGPSYRASNPTGAGRFARLSELSSPDGRLPQPLGVAVTWRALEGITVPALLVTGEADLYAPPPLQALVAGHLRNPRVETIREVGHAPYWEAPDTFNAIVLDFLQSSAAD